MISRNALYEFIEGLIEAAAVGDALYEAVIYRNIRNSVDQNRKVVRIEVLTGEHCMTSEDMRKELGVEATIQCWVLPEGTGLTDLDAAADASFDMSREIFEAIAGNTSLGGRVCDCDFREFETGHANLATAKRGVTYLDGVINHAS